MSNMPAEGPGGTGDLRRADAESAAAVVAGHRLDRRRQAADEPFHREEVAASKKAHDPRRLAAPNKA